MANKKHILAIDLVLIVGTLVLVLVLGSNYLTKPILLSPSDGFETLETKVLFVFEGDVILIDDNPDFTSAKEVRAVNNFIIRLEPGKYYWKVKEGFSEVREFTILSRVDLKLKDAGGGIYEVVNAGNTKLNVEVSRYGEPQGGIVLDVDESKEVSGTTEFRGSQSE